MNWLPICNFGLQIVTIIVLSACFIKVMKNDLTHLQKDTTEIKNNVNHLYRKVNNLCQRVSKIEGKLSK